MNRIKYTFAILALLLTCTSVQAQAEIPLRCSPVSFEVTLDAVSTTPYTIVGNVCTRGNFPGKTLQVLIHGASYDHTYWDSYPTPETSYVNTITKAGYTTLNIDRIGAGASDHPEDAFSISLHTHAWTVHQIVQVLRSGTLNLPELGHIQPGNIITVGFSLGSFIATIESSLYDDIDGVILTAYSHTLGPAAIASFDLAYPSYLDPILGYLNLSEGYLTSLPGYREMLFFYAPGTTPEMIALDEQLKGTYTVGEMADIMPSLSASLGVHVPTLLVDGDYDMIACLAPNCSSTGTLDNEGMNFAADSCFESQLIPNTGHSINWHNNAELAYDEMRIWADRRIGPDIHTEPTEPCN